MPTGVIGVWNALTELTGKEALWQDDLIAAQQGDFKIFERMDHDGSDAVGRAYIYGYMYAAVLALVIVVVTLALRPSSRACKLWPLPIYACTHTQPTRPVC